MLEKMKKGQQGAESGSLIFLPKPTIAYKYRKLFYQGNEFTL